MNLKREKMTTDGILQFDIAAHFLVMTRMVCEGIAKGSCTLCKVHGNLDGKLDCNNWLRINSNIVQR